MSDTDLAVARQNAELAARKETERLTHARERTLPLEIYTNLLVAAAGALVAVVVCHDVSYRPIWAIIAAGACVGALFTFLDLRRKQGLLGEAAVLAPTDLHLRLSQATEEAVKFRHVARVFEAWSLLQHETANRVFRFLAAINEYMRTLAPSALADERAVLNEVDKRFKSELDWLVGYVGDRRGELLNYDVSDIFFIDVFEFRPDERLYLAARRTNARILHGRSWGPEDGHLGECLRSGRDFFVNYLEDSREPTGQEEPTDKDYFACRISVLVHATDGRRYGAHGAICITSSRFDTLNKSQVAFVTNLAQSLAGLFYARETIYRRVRSNAGAHATTQAQNT